MTCAAGASRGNHARRAFHPLGTRLLSVIRDADVRIARIRYVMPRHWMTIWAANWVGLSRSRKSTQPGASGVIELSPCAGRMPVRRPSQTLALAATALRRQGPGMALPPECQPRPACGSDPAAPEAPAQVSRSSRAAHPSGDAHGSAIERAIFLSIAMTTSAISTTGTMPRHALTSLESSAGTGRWRTPDAARASVRVSSRQTGASPLRFPGLGGRKLVFGAETR